MKYPIILSLLLFLTSCAFLNRDEISNAKYARINDPSNPKVRASKIAPLIANAHWQHGFKLKKGCTTLYIANEILCLSRYGEFFWHKESPGIINGIYKIRDDQKGDFYNILQEMRDEETHRKNE